MRRTWMMPVLMAALMTGNSGVVTAQEYLKEVSDEIAELNAALVAGRQILADVQRDIDELETAISDKDTILIDVNGNLVPFDLKDLEELVPLARNLLSGEDELKKLIRSRSALLGSLMDILETTPDDLLPFAISSARALLEQSQEQKTELASGRLDELGEEYAAIDEAVGGLPNLIAEAEALRRGALAELSDAGRFDGVYTSTYGRELELQRDGAQVTGTYELDGGEVIFDVTDQFTLDGYWIETKSNQPCKTEREGSQYWGRLIIRFDEHYREYSGAWDYCETEPKNRGWSGELIRR